MQQNPPPFKRFARERFDGTSLYGQRPAIIPSQTHEHASQISTGDNQQSQDHSQSSSSPTAERNAENSTLPFLAIAESSHTLNDSRPGEESYDSHIVSPVAADVPHRWRLQPYAEEARLKTPTLSERRQYGPIRNEHGQWNLGASASISHPLPQPQLRPYSIASDDIPRSISQPNTPSFYPHTQQQSSNEPTPSIMTPGSSTQWQASRRRPRSVTGRGEANFTDEEFHLFVQATAGLGPEQSDRDFPPVYDASRGEVTFTRTEYVPPISPSPLYSEQGLLAPTQIAQQPALMPFRLQGPQQQEVVASRPLIQRLETSSLALDLWLQPPSAPVDDEYTVSPIEDELPDYATSQAQAQAEQRTEAARRAKELRRRWEESRY